MAGWTAAVLAVAVLAIAVWLWRTREPGRSELVKLTDDTGLTTDPAVSPDGRLLAYASDRGPGGNLNIWIQQLSPGGTAVQLTHHNLDAVEPAFSPDGTRIAYRSKQDGGGIYVVPVIGGEPARLTRSGRTPRFSPDGRWIAYWSGGIESVLPSGNTSGAIYVIPAYGGDPRRLGLDLPGAGNPIWSPDGKHLLVYVPPKQGFAWEEADWWLVAFDGTSSRRAHDFSVLKRQGFSLGFDRIPRLSQWTNNFISFSAGFGDAVNAWRAPISREGHITGPAERLTSGTTLETSPTLGASGELIFASLNESAAVWSLPADSDRATVTGELKRVTEGRAELMPSVSTNGTKLAFTAARTRTHSDAKGVGFRQGTSLDEPLDLPQEAADLRVRIKDLSTGKETEISSADTAQWRPQISRDGSMVAYTSGKPGQLYVAPVNGGSPRLIVGGKNGFAWDWSLDKRRLLFKSGATAVHSVDLQSGSVKLFLDRPGFGLFQANFSPDDQSVAVVGCRNEDPGAVQCQIFVVPIDNGAPASPERWITVNHQGRWDDKPRWSPNGSLIYFVSDRDGHLCLWAQRTGSRAKELPGTPFPVYHFHNTRLAMMDLGTGILEIDVAKDKVVVGLGEVTGNIWSLKRK